MTFNPADVPDWSGWKGRRDRARAKREQREDRRSDDAIRAAHIRKQDRDEQIARTRARQEAAETIVRNLERDLASLEDRALSNVNLLKEIPELTGRLAIAKAISIRTADIVAGEIAVLTAANEAEATK